MRKHKWFYRFGWAIGLVIILLIAGRVYLNTWTLNHVNAALRDIPGYQGSVGSIDIAIYRGAYRIHDLKIEKKSGGKLPVPFVDIAQIDLSIQWSALFEGKVVSNIELQKPVINFAVSKGSKQTGAGVDWTKTIKDLMPIDVNIVTFQQGKLTYQDFSSSPKVDVYINNMTGEIRNLRNVADKSQALPSTVIVKGDSIGKGKLNMKGRMNILKNIPDLDLNTELENVNLPALNNYFKAYAFIDVQKGNLSVYSNLVVKDGKVSGYVKPIASNIEMVDLRDSTNPIKLAWETVVSTVVTVFTNQRNGQIATKVPLQGNLNSINTDIWSTLAGIVRNAFVHAFDKGLDRDPKARD